MLLLFSLVDADVAAFVLLLLVSCGVVAFCFVAAIVDFSFVTANFAASLELCLLGAARFFQGFCGGGGGDAVCEIAGEDGFLCCGIVGFEPLAFSLRVWESLRFA